MFPAANLRRLAAKHGKPVIVVNPGEVEPEPQSQEYFGHAGRFVHLRGAAGQVLPEVVRRIGG